MRLTLFVAGAAIALASAAAGQQRVVVPAFFGLTTTTDSARGSDWSRIQAAGNAVQLVVALGGNGGFQTLTGPSLSNAQAQFNANRAVGQLVLGYVDTNPYVNTGSQPLPRLKVLGDMEAWYTAFPTQIDGIFYDDGPEYTPSGPTDSDFNSYYVQLYNDTKAAHAGKKVMLNSSAYPEPWIMTAPAADYATVWEDRRSNYYSSTFKAIGPGGNLTTPPSWWSNSTYTSAGKIAHIVFGATQLDVGNVVDFSRTNGSPSLYVHDNPSATYSGVSCFFEQEIAAVRNQPPVSGKTNCSGVCSDISTDTNNCGACGSRCTTNVCSGGVCGPCNAGFTLCGGGTCSDTSSDPNNCGGCGIVCPVTGWGAVPTCSAGYCGYDCGPYIDCFNGSCAPPGYSCP